MAEEQHSEILSN